jgi:hypothetical protein
VDTGLLPKERAANCKAFAATIQPYLDLDKMKAVQARSWDLSADGK